jgi:hypothetical protein
LLELVPIFTAAVAVPAIALTAPTGVPAPVGPVVVVLLVPCGVILFVPPAPPMSEFAATVPRRNLPLSETSSVHPDPKVAEQVPETIRTTAPGESPGPGGPCAPVSPLSPLAPVSPCGP